MKSKSKPPRGKAQVAPETADGRITYRELRNTPGRVWERLAANQLLTLVADGKAKAIVIPVEDGDAGVVLDAYRRGRAMLAISRIRKASRENGTAKMTLAEINSLIRRTRDDRRRLGRKG